MDIVCYFFVIVILYYANTTALHMPDRWADCEISQSESNPDPQKIESDPVVICKIFDNHRSDPLLIRQCETMYFILPHEAK